MERILSVDRSPAVLVGTMLLALMGTAAADAQKLRVGLIQRIEASGVEIDDCDRLRRCLVAIDGSASLGDHHFRLCLPEDVSPGDRTVVGACGRPVRVPSNWDFDADTKFYRGVICGTARPESKARGELTRHYSGAGYIVDGNLPNDLIAMIGSDGDWHVACDWNADLQCVDKEVFVLPRERLDQPHLFQRGDAVLVFQAVITPKPTEQLTLRLWTASKTSMAGWGHGDTSDPSVLKTLLRVVGQRDDLELVWIDAESMMPASIGSAMHAAKQLNCDIVFAGLEAADRNMSDMAKLYALCSRENGIPVVLNQRTIVSPNFMVDASLSSIPDIAEFQYERRRITPNAYADRVKELFADPGAIRNTASEKSMADGEFDPSSLFANAEDGIGHERFVGFGDGNFVVARVPFDAVDGHLLFGSTPVFSVSESGIRLYDAQGRRIKGDGSRRMPTTDVILGRGGYLVALEQYFFSGLKRRITSPEFRLKWTRAATPTIELQHSKSASSKQSVRLVSEDELPSVLQLNVPLRLARLRQFPSSEVPIAVKQAAGPLLEAGPYVRSWWYREKPRFGSIKTRAIYQEVRGELPAWNDSHLQLCKVYESGRRGSVGRMNETDHFVAQTAWILVQAFALPDDLREAPRLVQAIDRPSSDPLTSWERTQHQRQAVVRAGQNSEVWVDTFMGTTAMNVSCGADFMVSTFQSSAPVRQTFRWVRWIGMQPYEAPKPPGSNHEWMKHYDQDPLKEMLQQRLSTGLTASEILNATPKPSAGSDNIMAWRQYLIALDQPSIRKQHLNRVIVAADRVLQFCNDKLGGLPRPAAPHWRDEARLRCGGGDEDPFADVKAFSERTDAAGWKVYAWAADAAYRKVRAIGYRELPDVLRVHPIDDLPAQNEAFEKALHQLCGIAEANDPRFVLALIRHERRQGNAKRAYELLWRNAYEGPAMPWYFKKERDLFGDMGWEPLRRLGYARWFLRESKQGVPF
ncbi:MAG: hypothetical protein AB8B91_08170 [Rubripirellula sp.]